MMGKQPTSARDIQHVEPQTPKTFEEQLYESCPALADLEAELFNELTNGGPLPWNYVANKAEPMTRPRDERGGLTSTHRQMLDHIKRLSPDAQGYLSVRLKLSPDNKRVAEQMESEVDSLLEKYKRLSPDVQQYIHYHRTLKDSGEYQSVEQLEDELDRLDPPTQREFSRQLMDARGGLGRDIAGQGPGMQPHAQSGPPRSPLI